MIDRDSSGRIEPKFSTDNSPLDLEMPQNTRLDERTPYSPSSSSPIVQNESKSRSSIVWMTGVLLLLIAAGLWQMSRLQSRLFDTQEQLTQLTERSQVMESQMNASGVKWNEEQSKVLGQIESSSSGLKTEAENIKQNISQLKEQIKQTQSSVNTLQTNLNTKIESVNNDMAATKAAVENNSVATKVSQLEVDITGTKNTASELQTRIESLNQAIKKMEQDFNLVQISTQENTRLTELLDERFSSVSPQLEGLADQQEQFNQLSQQIESIMLFRKQTNAKLDQLEQQVVNLRSSSGVP